MSDEPGEAGGTARREVRSMIDVTPVELPSSISGQRDGALALLADQRDLGGPFRDFRCFEGDMTDETSSIMPSIIIYHAIYHMKSPL
jgi:hypothetical protein